MKLFNLSNGKKLYIWIILNQTEHFYLFEHSGFCGFFDVKRADLVGLLFFFMPNLNTY